MATQQVTEPERLFGEERQWCDRRGRAVAAAAEAEGTAGAALLEGGESAMQAQVQNLTRLRVESDACDAAIAEARRRRLEAVRDVWLAEASDLREQAKGIEAEASTRDTKTARLLKALEDWEGCRYVPEPPPEIGVSGGLAGGAPTVVHIPTPRTAILRSDAERLKAEAAVLDKRDVVKAASISTNDRDEVLLLVGGWDPMQLAPTLIGVEEWLQQNEPAALDRRDRRFSRENPPPISYTLIWQDGEIDVQRSRIAPVEG